MRKPFHPVTPALLATLLATGLAAAPGAWAGSSANAGADAGAHPDAAALHQQSCVSCHGTEVYTRSDRRVQSLPALGTQVRMCEQNLGLKWFDDDVDAVTALLNRDFYKFAE